MFNFSTVRPASLFHVPPTSPIGDPVGLMKLASAFVVQQFGSPGHSPYFKLDTDFYIRPDSGAWIQKTEPEDLPHQPLEGKRLTYDLFYLTHGSFVLVTDTGRFIVSDRNKMGNLRRLSNRVRNPTDVFCVLNWLNKL